MIKKMTLLAMVVGAVAAFAAPSMAGAAQLTNSGGGLVKPGTTLVGTSTNTVTSIGGGSLVLECENVTVNGIVAANAGGSVEVTMDGANDTATGCEVVGLGPVSIDPTLNNIKGAGAGPGTASFDFNVVGLCEEASTTSAVTWNGSDTIHIEADVDGGCGEGILTGDFTLETTTGAAIIAET